MTDEILPTGAIKITPPPRLDFLTGLRGIAAYSVLLGHGLNGAFQDYANPPLAEFATRIAESGITLFFVLSGFVIYYNYAEAFRTRSFAEAAYDFLVARFARLFPLFAFAGLIALAELPPPRFAGHPWALVASATMTQSWFNMQNALFNPLWTISTEWFFYFAFLGLVFMTFCITRPGRTLVLFVLFGYVAWLLLIAYKEPIGTVFDPVFAQPDPLGAKVTNWLVYVCPYTRILEFIAGILSAMTYLSLRERAVPSYLGVSAATALLCYALVLALPVQRVWPLSELMLNFLLVPAFTAVLVYAGLGPSPLNRALSRPVLVIAGEISYSVYVWHFWIFPALQNAYRSSTPSPISYLNSGIKLLLITFMATVLAYGSYLLIESPSRRWLRACLSARDRTYHAVRGTDRRSN